VRLTWLDPDNLDDADAAARGPATAPPGAGATADREFAAAQEPTSCRPTNQNRRTRKVMSMIYFVLD
jgi:hypothetical protein